MFFNLICYILSFFAAFAAAYYAKTFLSPLNLSWAMLILTQLVFAAGAFMAIFRAFHWIAILRVKLWLRVLKKYADNPKFYRQEKEQLLLALGKFARWLKRSGLGNQKFIEMSYKWHYNVRGILRILVKS